LLQPPLKENPSLLLVEVLDCGLDHLPVIAHWLVRARHGISFFSHPVAAGRSCALPWRMPATASGWMRDTADEVGGATSSPPAGGALSNRWVPEVGRSNARAWGTIATSGDGY
jgi:hypothetical protein